MSSITSRMQLTDQDVRTTSATQGGVSLGQQVDTSDGRRFRYGLNGTGGGTALVPGQLQQGAVVVANHVNRTGVTASAGTLTVTFAVGNTVVTANQYFQGYLLVNAGTGAGQCLEISGNTSAAGNGSPTVNLEDAVITATSVSDSKFSLIPNLYSACVISNATLAAGITGVPNVSIADTFYGWLQVSGEASVLSDASAPASGLPFTYSDETNGALGTYETDAVGPVLGYTTQAAVSAEYRAVFLTIN